MLAASNARQVKNIYPRTQLRFHNILLFLAQQFLNPIECSFSHVIYDLSINSANGRQVYICVKYIAPNSGSPHGMSSAIQALFLAVGFMRWYISHQQVWKRFEKQIYQICLMRNLHSSKHHHNTIDCLIVTMSLLFFSNTCTYIWTTCLHCNQEVQYFLLPSFFIPTVRSTVTLIMSSATAAIPGQNEMCIIFSTRILGIPSQSVSVLILSDWVV